MAGNDSNITQQAWHLPVAYLFGGVATMVGLFAVALFVLACSSRKLSVQFEASNSGGHYNDSAATVECGEKKIEVCREDIEEKVMVIMAGNEKPTFLAKPAWSSAGDMKTRV